jgi:hypothetical protein
MPNRKNFALRDSIYDLISAGLRQSDILIKLEEKGFKIGKSWLSQIIKEFEEDEYILPQIRTSYTSYRITKKPYPYRSRSLGMLPGEGRNKLRNHNISYKYKITRITKETNDIKKWDRIIPMNYGVKQYIYYGHDYLGREINLQRLEGKNRDTLTVKIADLDWDYDKLKDLDLFIDDKLKCIEPKIMHRFKMQIVLIGPNTKQESAIAPAPFSDLQQAFMDNNYSFGDLHGDCSKGIPELETTNREKAIAIMEFLNLADSGYLPQLVDVLIKLKKIGISPEIIIDIMKTKNDFFISLEKENRERGVIG